MSDEFVVPRRRLCTRKDTHSCIGTIISLLLLLLLFSLPHPVGFHAPVRVEVLLQVVRLVLVGHQEQDHELLVDVLTIDIFAFVVRKRKELSHVEKCKDPSL